jgi:uncharacterized protein
MSDAILDASARLIREELWRGRQAGIITFHGGEPLLAGHLWFERALGVLAQITGVRFSLQSNLWLMDDPFAELFARYRVSVSTSLDGNREICDAQRGEGYFEKTMAGINLLRQKGHKVTCIATVLPENIDRVPEIIAFFDAEGLSFTIRGAEPSLQNGYVNYLPAQETERLYGQVLDYIERNPAPSRIRDLEVVIRNVLLGHSELCTFSDCLGHYAAISPEGDVYTCQRFSGAEEYRIGSVYDTVEMMMESAAYKRIAAVHEKARQNCGECGHFPYCNGGCEYNILVAEKYGKPWPHCNDAEPSGKVYQKLFDSISIKLAAEAADVMLGVEAHTPYLLYARDNVRR